MMRSTVATAFACAILMISCGGDVDRGVTGGTTIAPDDVRLPNGDRDPASVVITLDDLPEGWTHVSSGRDRRAGDPATTCLDMLFEEQQAFVRDDPSSAVNAFQRPGMFLQTVVVRGYTQAGQFLDELPDATDACDGSADGHGGTVSRRTAHRSRPTAGAPPANECNERSDAEEHHADDSEAAHERGWVIVERVRGREHDLDLTKRALPQPSLTVGHRRFEVLVLPRRLPCGLPGHVRRV
jgi:hypothetical protein